MSGSVVVAFDAATPGPVKRVTFSLDTGEIITSTETALGGIIWNTTGAVGDHRLKVSVEDSAGNVGENEIAIVVVPPIALDVELEAPEATVGGSVVLTALVASELGGATVEAFVGRTQVGVQANQQGAVPFVVDTTPFPPGRYGILVRATDAQGNVVTDDTQVLAIAAAANNNPTPAGLWADFTAWLGSNWLWIAGVLLGLLLLWLIWLIVRSIVRSLRRGRQTRLAARNRVVPQVRMLVTNAGNTRTPFRLRAEAPSGDLVFTFMQGGLALLPPLATRVSSPAPVTNGRSAPSPIPVPIAPPPSTAAPAGVTAAPQPATQPTTRSAAAAYEGAKQASDVGSRLLNSIGKLLPGPAGAPFRSAGNALVAQQTAVVRAQGQVNKTVAATQDVGYYGKQMAPAGAAAGSVAPAYATTASAGASGQPAYSSAPAPAPVPAPQPKAPAPVNPAFELQDAPAGTGRAVSSGWVETAPIAPGETVGIDIHVARRERSRRNDLVTFNVISAPSDGGGADTLTDAVSVRLNNGR